MAWLVRDTTVLASVDVADSFGARLRGLLGRDGLDGALLLRPARGVHTIGMRFPIDVAFCDRDLRVLAVATLPPYRVSRPVRGACVVIEAERGAFERWGLAVGDELAVHGEPPVPPDDGSGSGGAARAGARLLRHGRHRLMRRATGARASGVRTGAAGSVPPRAVPVDGAPARLVPARSVRVRGVRVRAVPEAPAPSC